MGDAAADNPSSKRLRTVQMYEEDIHSQNKWDFALGEYFEYLQHFPFRADEVQTMMLPIDDIDDTDESTYQRCLIRETYKTIGENIIKHSNKWDASRKRKWRDLHGEITEESQHFAVPDGNRNAVLVTGNPGIGKSLFAFYSIAQILQRYTIDLFIGYRSSGEDSCPFVLKRQSGVISIVFGRDVKFLSEFEFDQSDFTSPHRSFYFLDALDFKSGGPGTTILITSPKRKRYGDFKKRAGESRRKLVRYMPLWTPDEISFAARFYDVPLGTRRSGSDLPSEYVRLYPKEAEGDPTSPWALVIRKLTKIREIDWNGDVDVAGDIDHDRMRFFGGIPRNVFAEKSELLDKLNDLEEDIEPRDARHVGCTSKDRRDVSHVFFADLVNDEKLKPKKVFVSQYSAYRFKCSGIEMKLDKLKEMWLTWKDVPSRQMTGNHFEMYVHKLFSSGRIPHRMVIQVESDSSTCEAKSSESIAVIDRNPRIREVEHTQTMTEFDIQTRIANTDHFECEEDLKAITMEFGHYYFSQTRTTIPTVDSCSLVKIGTELFNAFYQITIADHHEVNAKGLPLMRSVVGNGPSDRRTLYVFVVPSDVYESWIVRLESEIVRDTNGRRLNALIGLMKLDEH